MLFQFSICKINNKNQIIFIIIIAFTMLTISSCSRIEENTFPNVDALLCETSPEPPILTEKDAICFTMSFDGIADSMRSAQKIAEYSGWIVKARHRNDLGWDVYIRSKGKLPSYACALSFNKYGKIIENQESSILCGYQK